MSFTITLEDNISGDEDSGNSYLEKLKTLSCTIFSFTTHLIIIFGLFNVVSNLKLQNPAQISSVSVISGDNFKELTNDNSLKNTKINPPILKKKISAKKQASSAAATNHKIGSKDSINDSGLEMDLANKNNDSINNSYVNILANKLESQKSQISLEAAPNNIQTKVVVKMKLDKNGNLTSYKIVEESSSIFFDKVAKKVVKYAAPFPKPPTQIVNSSLEFVVPIFFDTIL
jgi:TonB family protein